nr:cyclase family protein [Alphaproteobacteria bacterium]
MKRSIALTAMAVAVWFGGTGDSAADKIVIDLTHPIPTFKPMEGDPMKPDLSKPWGDGRLHPTFGQHAILSIFEFPTGQGHFDIGQIILSEHHGTHLDTAAHYINNADSMEEGGTPPGERKLAHQLGAKDLIGSVVLIDISGRVQAELEKNGGQPSPDASVTDFSNASGNVVTADDIEDVKGDLKNGVWLVLNLGWAKFYFEGPDFVKDPYINGWNHPGLAPAAVDKLIEIMDDKGIKIAGIVADNLGIDSGEAAKGEDDKFTNAFYAHVRLLQRNILFVENAANLDALAM